MSTRPRRVVITGASRGLGFASAVRLHRLGWHVIGAMRSPEVGLARLRDAAGASTDDERLRAVRLDLQDAESIAAAAREIEDLVGAPDAVVHNAGAVAVGCVEELPAAVFEEIFATNLFGAMRLTQRLLPSMRAAGAGRIVVVSSESAVHGMPAASAYSASKAALERWAEALAAEVAPFGIGVTVLVTGTFDTDILDRDHVVTYADLDGPYGELHRAEERLERRVTSLARPPEQFAVALAKALDEQAPFARHAVGPDARALMVGRWLMPGRFFQGLLTRALRLPGAGSLARDPRRFAAVHPPPDVGPPG